MEAMQQNSFVPTIRLERIERPWQRRPPRKVMNLLGFIFAHGF
jgi:hypothetical protein